jgi:hypothetical protein
LSGRYGFTIQGTQFEPPPAVLAAFVGVVEFDGQGALRGSDVGSFGGQVVPRTFSGTYTVNPNCTASVTLTVLSGFPVGLTVHLSTVILQFGGNLMFIQTDQGSQFIGSAARQ